MLTSSDFRELLSLFREHRVRHLVVNGYAVMKYSEPRFTKDLDLWIATDPGNAASVYAALQAFGAPLKDLSPSDFSQPDHFYQMGRAPLRVDVMMSLGGVPFEEAWKNRVIVRLDDLEIPFISRADLIRAKEAAGRPQDKIDVEKLKQAERLDAGDEQ